jgi:hypothetical protein
VVSASGENSSPNKDCPAYRPPTLYKPDADTLAEQEHILDAYAHNGTVAVGRFRHRLPEPLNVLGLTRSPVSSARTIRSPWSRVSIHTATAPSLYHPHDSL